jgi:hypothetical protein
MRERDVEAVALAARPADGLVERDTPPVPLDRELPDEKHDLRSEQCKLLLEPRRAERDLGRCGPPVALTARRLSGKALRDRGPVRQLARSEAGFRHPLADDVAGPSAEWSSGLELHGSRRLTDDRDPVRWLALDHGSRVLEVSRGDALGARADACLQPTEGIHGLNGRLAVRYGVWPSPV